MPTSSTGSTHYQYGKYPLPVRQVPTTSTVSAHFQYGKCPLPAQEVPTTSTASTHYQYGKYPLPAQEVPTTSTGSAHLESEKEHQQQNFMAKNEFIPPRDAEKADWIEEFGDKLPTYATKYNITTTEIADIVNGAASFRYWLKFANEHNGFVLKAVKYKNEIKTGVPAGGTASLAPVAPDLGAAPTAVPPGVFVRASQLAQVIKNKSNYTEADGVDMGIEGTTIEEQPVSEAKPILKVVLVSGGVPEIQWVKKKMDALEIQVDRGDGTWQFLAIDTVPHYTDTLAVPAGTSATWKYRAIYRLDDVRVGNWSDTVNITVQG